MKRRRLDLAHLSSYDPAYKALWQRVKRGSMPMAEYRKVCEYKRTHPRLCTVEGCKTPLKTKFYCAKHYHRWLRHGDPLKLVRPQERIFRAKSDRKRVAKPWSNMAKYYYETDLTPEQLKISREARRVSRVR